MEKEYITILRGGLIATTVMTIMMLLAPMMGMPKMDIGKMLAGFLHLPVTMGWVMHFVIGIVLSGFHILKFKSILPGNNIIRGMLFSLIPFFMAQLVVMPMMGAGVFSSNTPAPGMMVMGSLFGHLVYGAVLGMSTSSIKKEIPKKVLENV